MMVSNTNVHFKEFYKIQNNQENIYKNNYILTDEIDTDVAVKFDNVNFKYFNSDIDIFEGLSFDITKGKHTIITGPNGSGKSTILGLISGIFYPQNGTVKVNSKNLGMLSNTINNKFKFKRKTYLMD